MKKFKSFVHLVFFLSFAGMGVISLAGGIASKFAAGAFNVFHLAIAAGCAVALPVIYHEKHW